MNIDNSYNCYIMNQLFNKFRELSIRDLKARRDEIFQNSRRIISGHQNTLHQTQQEENFEQLQYQEMENSQQDLLQQTLEDLSTYTHKKNKKKPQNFKIQRYWRQLLQTADWMVDVPDNLNQFYTAVRPDGHKCLIIIKDYRLQIRDKSGRQLLSCQISSKQYNGTIFEGYYNQSSRFVVISDLIAWKNNPMTSSQFEFRYSWLISNFPLSQLAAWTDLFAFFIGYQLCTLASLEKVYQKDCGFPKDGLLFVHKDSFYLHSLNPSVLIWKDKNVSKYFEQQIQKNSITSRGIGFLNKSGEVKSLQNVVLFRVDRQTIQQSHRFLKFQYTNLSIQNLAESKIVVSLQSPIIIQTVRYYSGPIDSLAKLLFKCNIKKGLNIIEHLVIKLTHSAEPMIQ